MRIALIPIAVLGLALATTAPALAGTSGPPTPIDLFNAFQACSTDPGSPVYVDARGFGGLDLEALSPDTADSPNITEQFQVYPVSDPSQVVTFTNQFALPGIEQSVSVPSSDLTDGQTYAWQVQTVAASGTSPLSAPCYITIDDTSPSSAPTVSSSNYPSGQFNQGGAPIQITFGANGVSDVAGYVFSWDGVLPVIGTPIGPHGIPQPTSPWTTANPVTGSSGFVQASSVGGSASFGMIPSTDTGFLVLTVASLDRAFNESQPTTFFIFVKRDAPTVIQLAPNPQFGQNAQFRLTPDPGIEAASPVVSYNVAIGDQQPFTVKASANGTAEFGATLNSPFGANVIFVSSQSADGWVSQNQIWNDQLNTTPAVTSNIYLGSGAGGGPGVPDTFTFDLKIKGIASFTYGFSDGTTGTVKADGSGLAQITWTPQQSGFYIFEVYATTKSGEDLLPYFNVFTVN